MSRPLIAWGGLDFDATELDRDLREALAVVAPVGGAMRALPLVADPKRAADALFSDFNHRHDAAGVDALIAALDQLEAAKVALLQASQQLTQARLELGLDQ